MSGGGCVCVGGWVFVREAGGGGKGGGGAFASSLE